MSSVIGFAGGIIKFILAVILLVVLFGLFGILVSFVGAALLSEFVGK